VKFENTLVYLKKLLVIIISYASQTNCKLHFLSQTKVTFNLVTNNIMVTTEKYIVTILKLVVN